MSKEGKKWPQLLVGVVRDTLLRTYLLTYVRTHLLRKDEVAAFAATLATHQMATLNDGSTVRLLGAAAPRAQPATLLAQPATPRAQFARQACIPARRRCSSAR